MALNQKAQSYEEQGKDIFKQWDAGKISERDFMKRFVDSARERHAIEIQKVKFEQM